MNSEPCHIDLSQFFPKRSDAFDYNKDPGIF